LERNPDLEEPEIPEPKYLDLATSEFITGKFKPWVFLRYLKTADSSSDAKRSA
jgi:hypothetical protein